MITEENKKNPPATKGGADKGIPGCKDWSTHPYMVVVSEKDCRGDVWETQFRTLEEAMKEAEFEVEHMASFELKRRNVIVLKRDETYAEEPWAGMLMAEYDHEEKVFHDRDYTEDEEAKING